MIFLKKVSVIVPVYNTQKYLRTCLDSLVHQTLKDIEIVVVDDGSTDGSTDIIREYSEKYPEIIKAFYNKNSGVSASRNFGISKATGKYIGFVDSDDYVKRELFLKLYNYATKNDVDIVLFDWIVKNGNMEYVASANLNYSTDPVKNYIIAPPMPWNRIVKRDILVECPYKDGIIYEDLEAIPSYILKTKKVDFLNYVGYYYVVRDTSIMNQKKFNKKFLDIFTALECNKKRLVNDYPMEVEYLYITHLLRSTSLRFVNSSEGKDYLNKIVSTMKENFPNWQDNIYYKKSSFKLRIVCKLAYHKHSLILKLLKKLFRK